MLRITATSRTDGALGLKLEGKLLGPWTDELLSHLPADPQANLAHLQLDLRHLTFVDVSGTNALRHLIARGAVVTHSSNYVAELLGATGRICP